MTHDSALRAAAPGAPAAAIGGFHAARCRLAAAGALDNARRAAHLIGQTAHESLGFSRREENLDYRTPERLMAVWPARFADARAARRVIGDPPALAEHVYGGRLGNTEPGDGWRYRGRGWLQLTGRANYRAAGARLGLDLEAAPGRAAEPAIAWAIAADYLAHRRRGGRSALDWADRDDLAAVTRIVNGGLTGLADRRARTARALAALMPLETWRPAARGKGRGLAVAALQAGLARAGHDPGPLDGIFGPRTAAALLAHDRTGAVSPPV